MKQCEWCDRTAAAVRTGFWPEELRAHAAACEDCAETMLVAGALLEAATLEAPGGLPSAGLVWWKAQLRLRREQRERMERPLRWFDRGVTGVGILAAAWGMGWLAGGSELWAGAGVGTAVVLAAVILAAAAGSAYWLAARLR
jgi:hypothetical protein